MLLFDDDDLLPDAADDEELRAAAAVGPEGLVESGALEGFGNLRRPRFSEVRRAE